MLVLLPIHSALRFVGNSFYSWFFLYYRDNNDCHKVGGGGDGKMYHGDGVRDHWWGLEYHGFGTEFSGKKKKTQQTLAFFTEPIM